MGLGKVKDGERCCASLCRKRFGERFCVRLGVRFGETLGEGLSDRLCERLCEMMCNRLARCWIQTCFKFTSNNLEVRFKSPGEGHV